MEENSNTVRSLSIGFDNALLRAALSVSKTEGVVLGMRPELVGGSGSVGEWFAVKSPRRRRIEESTDERIWAAEHL